MQEIKYPSIEKIIGYNFLALTLIKVKRADQLEVLSYGKIKEILTACETKQGDLYNKAVVLLKGIVQKHPFASGNKRTAFITAKNFLLDNKGKLGVKEDPSCAKIMAAIRHDYYTDEELKGWLQHGQIRAFNR